MLEQILKDYITANTIQNKGDQAVRELRAALITLGILRVVRGETQGQILEINPAAASHVASLLTQYAVISQHKQKEEFDELRRKS